MHPVCKKGCWADKLILRGEALRKDNDRLERELASAEETLQDMVTMFFDVKHTRDHWKAERCYERMFGRKLKKGKRG